jgi:hypothetical protein
VKRRITILLAWFERRDAIPALLGFRMPQPADDVRLHEARYEAARAALLARPPFGLPAPQLEPLPDVIADRGALAVERMRAYGHPRVRAGVLDLTRVLSFQKAITLDDIADRVAAAQPDDWPALAAITLPDPKRFDDEMVHGTFDRDGKGVTITSFNPNLRVGPIQQIVGAVPEAGQLVGFSIAFGSPYVHVVEYKGRCFLKDGYHRTYGLLARGITRVPCLYEQARSFSDVHSGGTTHVTQEYLLGDHPPLLTDALEPLLTETVEQQLFRKVVRIRAEEFVVPV